MTTVLVALFWVPVFGHAPAIEAGEATPFIGLFERLAFSAHFLWTIVFAVVLWSRPLGRSGKSG